jgi:hypothetical protein
LSTRRSTGPVLRQDLKYQIAFQRPARRRDFDFSFRRARRYRGFNQSRRNNRKRRRRTVKRDASRSRQIISQDGDAGPSFAEVGVRRDEGPQSYRETEYPPASFIQIAGSQSHASSRSSVKSPIGGLHQSSWEKSVGAICLRTERVEDAILAGRRELEDRAAGDIGIARGVLVAAPHRCPIEVSIRTLDERIRLIAVGAVRLGAEGVERGEPTGSSTAFSTSVGLTSDCELEFYSSRQMVKASSPWHSWNVGQNV